MWLLWLGACRFLVSEDIGDLEKDIEQACKIAERIDAESPGKQDKKLARLVKRAADEHAGPAIEALLELLAQTPPRMRRKLLNETLQRNGMADLKCPALERIIMEI